MPCKGKSFSSLPAAPAQVLQKVKPIVKGNVLYREIRDLENSLLFGNALYGEIQYSWKSIAKGNAL